MRTRTNWPLFLPLFFIWFTGCATVESAHPAHPIGADGRLSKNRETTSGLAVSGEELEELSSPHFGVLAFTFVNPTSEWLRIDDVNLDFGGEAQNNSIALPWGEEITSWELATSQRNAIRHANTTVLLSGLMAGGILAASVGGRSTAGRIGGVVALGAAGGMWARAVSDNTAAATFPPAHLFATPFSVPPGLFAKKWVLLNGPKTLETGCIRSVVLEYNTGKERERVKLHFSRSSSDWQKADCGHG